MCLREVKGCLDGITGMLEMCYWGVTGVLEGCEMNVTGALQGYYRAILTPAKIWCITISQESLMSSNYNGQKKVYGRASS